MTPLRRAAFAFALLAGLLLAGVLGFQFALRELEAAVRDALGPRATLAGLSIDRGGVELRGLRIAAERSGRSAWPVADELRAERVRLVPRWRAMWGAGWALLRGAERSQWQLARIEVDQATVSVLRTRDGRLRVLPALLERPSAGADGRPVGLLDGSTGAPPSRPVRAGPSVAAVLLGLGSARADTGSAHAPAARPAFELLIGAVLLKSIAVDFHDASVMRPAHRLQLGDLQAELGAIAWPRLDEPVSIKLQARLQGRAGAVGEAAGTRDGDIRIDGWLTPATRDAELAVVLRGVDLRVLQPYLLGVHDGGIRRGLLDLRLDATVRQLRLRAPGSLVLTQLELGRSPGALGGVTSLAQQLVLAAVRERGRIELKFTLDGRLDDPRFSVNEDLATRIGVGLAEALGVSVGDAVGGVGGLLKGLFGR